MSCGSSEHQFVNIVERFEADEVASGFREQAALFFECSGDGFGRGPIGVGDACAGTAGAGDEDIGTGFASSEDDGLCVDGRGFVREAIFGKADSVGAERVRFDDVSASGDVIAVDGADQIGLGGAEIVVAGVNENALVVDHCSHGAVEDERVLEEGGEHGRGAACRVEVLGVRYSVIGIWPRAACGAGIDKAYDKACDKEELAVLCQLVMFSRIDRASDDADGDGDPDDEMRKKRWIFGE